MKITLNFKILSIVLFSILIALVINSLVHYNNIKKDYLLNFYTQSEMDISIVKSNMYEYEKRVANLLENIVKDEQLIASLNLISNYQDKENYEAVIFDVEKKKLLEYLDSKINNVERFSFGLFDRDKEPVLINRESNQKKLRGIFTYRDNKFKILDLDKNTLKDAPVLHNIDHKYLSKAVITVEEKSIGIRVIKGIYNKNNELVGYFRVKKIFDQGNINTFSKNTTNNFSFIIGDYVLGDNSNIATALIKKISLDFETDTHNYKELFGDDIYHYHSHYFKTFDGNKLYFVVSIEKRFLDNKFKDLIIQLILTAVAATLISFIIMIYFLKVNLLNRIDILVDGIRKIKAKEYVNIPTTKEKDEVDEIADELNTLTRELRESFVRIEKLNEFLQRIIDTVPVRIFWKDKECKYLGANKLFLKDAGFESSEELIGKDDYDMPWGTKEAADFRNDDNFVMKTKQPKLLVEESITTAKGKVITHLKSKVPMFDSDNNVIGILGVYEDITEQKMMEKELKDKDLILYESSKMASMGEMLESIAHQWRQPLSVITTGATGIMINKEYGILSDEMLSETLDSIENSAMHLSQTIDDFRDFYKKDKNKYIFNLKDALEKSINLVKSKLKNRDIEVILDLDDVDFNGFENELIQVFMNIINNAIDVLEDMDGFDRYIFISLKVENEKVKIFFKDNAGGIKEDLLPFIFDHKFTTKQEKDGTGIGLYMSKLIIEKSDGEIKANSVNYKYNEKNCSGAEFIIELPFDPIFS